MPSIAPRFFFPATWTFVLRTMALVAREGVMPPGVCVLLGVAFLRAAALIAREGVMPLGVCVLLGVAFLCAMALSGREGMMPPGVRVLLRVAFFFIPRGWGGDAGHG